MTEQRVAMQPPDVSLTANPYWDEVAPILILPPEPLSYHYTDAALLRRIEAEITQRQARDVLVRKYSWAVPDPDSLAFVARHLGASAIEIGAGTGYWASLLSRSGVDIQAYDARPPDQEKNGYFNEAGAVPCWYPVQRGGPEVLVEHADRALFLCWPPYATDMAYQCLLHYSGRRLVYIGESEGGCTADDDFFEELDKRWQEVAFRRIVRWHGLNDCIEVYDRLPTAQEAEQ